MLKVVFFVHKRPDLDAEEFRRHWRETQGLLGAKIPGTRKYVQNHTSNCLPLWVDQGDGGVVGSTKD